MSSKVNISSVWFDSKNDSPWNDSFRDGLVRLQSAGVTGKAYIRTTKVVWLQGRQNL